MKVFNTSHEDMTALEWVQRTTFSTEAQTLLSSRALEILGQVLEDCVMLYVVHGIKLPRTQTVSKGTTIQWHCGGALFLTASGNELNQFRPAKISGATIRIRKGGLDLKAAKEVTADFFDSWLKPLHGVK